MDSTSDAAPGFAGSSAPPPPPPSDDLRKDLAASVAWSFQALLAAAAFCAVTAASHDDWELLAGAAAQGANGDIEVPIVGLKVAFLFFFLVGPPVLLAMQVYLQVQSRALLRLGSAASANGLLSNHEQWWPLSLLGFASYAALPLTTAFLLWKVWPRRFVDDPLLFGDVRMNVFTGVIALYFLAACVSSWRGAWEDWRCLRLTPDHAGRPRRLNRFRTALAALLLPGLVAALAVALPMRRLEMRKAPMERSDLRYFDMRGADLREARLTGALMGGAMLADAEMGGATLDDADLRGAQLSRADLSYARLNDADLTGAWLVKANLLRVEAEGARFQYAWMPGALLEPVPRTSLNRTAAPTDAERAYAKAGVITAANFDQAKLCGAQIMPGHWARDVSLGEGETTGGPPFYDPRNLTDDRQMPPGFRAEPFPHGPGQPQGRADFVAERLARCMTELKVCEAHGFPQPCGPDGAPAK